MKYLANSYQFTSLAPFHYFLQGGRILSIHLSPRSVKHRSDGSCDFNDVMAIPENPQAPISVTYSYSITFTVSS